MPLADRDPVAALRMLSLRLMAVGTLLFSVSDEYSETLEFSEDEFRSELDKAARLVDAMRSVLGG